MRGVPPRGAASREVPRGAPLRAPGAASGDGGRTAACVFTLGRQGGVSAGGSRFFRINLWAPLVPQTPGESPGEPERGRGPEGHRVPGGPSQL